MNFCKFLNFHQIGSRNILLLYAIKPKNGSRASAGVFQHVQFESKTNVLDSKTCRMCEILEICQLWTNILNNFRLIFYKPRHPAGRARQPA